MPVNIRNLRLYLFSKNCERVKHRVDLNRYITQPETVINNKKKALVNPHQENAKPATYPSSREFTIEIAPIAAMPPETESTYRPAVLPAERKSETLLTRPLTRVTE